MFKQLYELAKNMLMLTEAMQQNQTNIKILQQELKSLTEIVQGLLMAAALARQNQTKVEELQEELRELRGDIQKLTFNIDLTRNDEKHEREIMALRLENELLKFERRLPAMSVGKDEKKDE